MTGYEKVGRLKADEVNDTIRVIIEDLGDIDSISKVRMEILVAGIEPVIESGSDVVFEFRFGEAGYRVLGKQVKNMMEKWPNKKAAVWRGEGNKN